MSTPLSAASFWMMFTTRPPDGLTFGSSMTSSRFMRPERASSIPGSGETRMPAQALRTSSLCSGADRPCPGTVISWKRSAANACMVRLVAGIFVKEARSALPKPPSKACEGPPAWSSPTTKMFSGLKSPCAQPMISASYVACAMSANNLMRALSGTSSTDLSSTRSFKLPSARSKRRKISWPGFISSDLAERCIVTTLGLCFSSIR
mmetsp:Transcript_63227/g.124533  ORF Transcript_63227/g.124533 Transcript_63227/m.124533 type:complete len:206 (-) Transcript_63227:468-1085(-)